MSSPRIRPALVEFMRARGELSAAEGALCVLGWLVIEEGAEVVTAREVRALYPRRELPVLLPPLHRAPESLATSVRQGLLEVAGVAAYRLTSLGRAVVLAF